MKILNICRELGYKLFLRNAIRAIAICGLLCTAQSVSMAQTIETTSTHYGANDTVVVEFDPPIGAGTHSVWVCPCSWTQEFAIAEPFCKQSGPFTLNPGATMGMKTLHRARDYGTACECFDVIYDANNDGGWDLKDDDDVIEECSDCKPTGNQAGFHIVEKPPTVSEWGMVVLALLLMTGIGIKFGRRALKTG